MPGLVGTRVKTVDVTVISCLYGDTHDRFVADWSNGIKHLDPFPGGIVIVGCDTPHHRVLGGQVFGPCAWKHPQAFYLQKALELVDTEIGRASCRERV